MRKLLLVTILSLVSFAGFCQTPTLQQKLYYTSKVWGFVKYYHSEVSTCHVNWDSVLLHVLPAVRAAADDNAFNDALDTMLAAAGPMTLSSTYFPDTLPAELKRNRDFSWMGASTFRSDVQIQLDTIRNNFRPHAECWVQDNDYSTSYGGWLVLPHDSLELDVNTVTDYPDADHRMLMFFKYWNVVRYFYPYNYVMDVPWDTTLGHYSLKFDTVSNAQSMFDLCMNLNTRLNDEHTYGLSYSNAIQNEPGFYKPYIRLKYTEGQYVVIKSGEAGIYPGDAIISVDGMTTAQWEDSLSQFLTAGNISDFRRNMCDQMLGRKAEGTIETMVVQDSTGANHTFTPSSAWWPAVPDFFGSWYYPADSLNSLLWTTMPCDIGYVNMGNLQDANVDAMYSALQFKSAIIFDIRNYPNGTAFPIADLIYPGVQEFAKFTIPDVTYPGTYSIYHDYLGVNGNPTPYAGKVIILMDEQTQSHAEFSCMILEAMPNVVKVGSQTAGADGNINYWKLTQDTYTGFTSLGVFYPNGDSTQRIGIVPDSVIHPTRAGIRHGRDEVLEKALQIAGCDLNADNVHNLQSGVTLVSVHPNPVNDIVTVDAKNIKEQGVTISINDVTGRVLLQKDITNNTGSLTASFDTNGLPSGMYFVTVKTVAQQYVTKIIKQ